MGYGILRSDKMILELMGYRLFRPNINGIWDIHSSPSPKNGASTFKVYITTTCMNN